MKILCLLIFLIPFIANGQQPMFSETDVFGFCDPYYENEIPFDYCNYDSISSMKISSYQFDLLSIPFRTTSEIDSAIAFSISESVIMYEYYPNGRVKSCPIYHDSYKGDTLMREWVTDGNKYDTIYYLFSYNKLIKSSMDKSFNSGAEYKYRKGRLVKYIWNYGKGEKLINRFHYHRLKSGYRICRILSEKDNHFKDKYTYNSNGLLLKAICKRNGGVVGYKIVTYETIKHKYFKSSELVFNEIIDGNEEIYTSFNDYDYKGILLERHISKESASTIHYYYDESGQLKYEITYDYYNKKWTCYIKQYQYSFY